jgi:methyl-accepting chemotaxis protein
MSVTMTRNTAGALFGARVGGRAETATTTTSGDGGTGSPPTEVRTGRAKQWMESGVASMVLLALLAGVAVFGLTQNNAALVDQGANRRLASAISIVSNNALDMDAAVLKSFKFPEEIPQLLQRVEEDQKLIDDAIVRSEENMAQIDDEQFARDWAAMKELFEPYNEQARRAVELTGVEGDAALDEFLDTYKNIDTTIDRMELRFDEVATAQGKAARESANRLKMIVILVSLIAVALQVVVIRGSKRSRDERAAAMEQTRLAAERETHAAEDLRNRTEQLLEVMRVASAGDLTVAVSIKGEDPIGQMGETLEEFLADLRSKVTHIAQAAEAVGQASETLSAVSTQMGANAEETSAQANVVSAAAEEVSASVGTVATGAEEMSASIKEIAANASNAATVASEAVGVAARTNDTVSKLGDSSAEIGQIIKVITSIAQQTNLLALNATIEAARAGEAGKGFAVVANEVKELAKETARATEDISQKIEAIQSDTGDAVVAIGSIGEIIEQISGIQNTIASAVEEQAATTAEIGRNVTEAARGSNEIAQNISTVAEAAGSTSSGVSEAQASAHGLSDTSTTLRELVSQFTI